MPARRIVRKRGGHEILGVYPNWERLAHGSGASGRGSNAYLIGQGRLRRRQGPSKRACGRGYLVNTNLSVRSRGPKAGRRVYPKQYISGAQYFAGAGAGSEFQGPEIPVRYYAAALRANHPRESRDAGIGGARRRRASMNPNRKLRKPRRILEDRVYPLADGYPPGNYDLGWTSNADYSGGVRKRHRGGAGPTFFGVKLPALPRASRLAARSRSGNQSAHSGIQYAGRLLGGPRFGAGRQRPSVAYTAGLRGPVSAFPGQLTPAQKVHIMRKGGAGCLNTPPAGGKRDSHGICVPAGWIAV